MNLRMLPTGCAALYPWLRTSAPLGPSEKRVRGVGSSRRYALVPGRFARNHRWTDTIDPRHHRSPTPSIPDTIDPRHHRSPVSRDVRESSTERAHRRRGSRSVATQRPCYSRPAAATSRSARAGGATMMPRFAISVGPRPKSSGRPSRSHVMHPASCAMTTPAA